MKHSKNIDRLFQEKFKDFEATPHEKIWKNIESSLQQKKKKRRIIPFWWKFSGVAALFAIGFIIMNQKYEQQISKDAINSKNQILTTSDISKSLEKEKSNAVVSSEKDKNATAIQNLNKNDNVLITQKNTSDKANKTRIATAIISETMKIKETNNSRISRISNRQKGNSHFSVTQIVEKTSQSLSNKNETMDKNLYPDNELVSIKNNLENKNESKNTTNNTISEVITELIATKTDVLQNNELEQLLSEKDKNNNKKSALNKNRWEVTTTIAPIVSGSISNDSPIDSKLNSNAKIYQNSISYGVGASYNLSKKLSIRTAINKLVFDNITNDVAFLENTQEVVSLSSISNQNTLQFIAENSINNTDTFTLASTTINTGNLQQEYGYVEVPVEMCYAIIDRKFKINLITGISTLFLDKNNISLTSQKYNASLGEANNINKINFSSNVGLGFKYNLYKSFYINLDSILKYQLNTFNKNSGNFNPFIVGFYTGLGIKF